MCFLRFKSFNDDSHSLIIISLGEIDIILWKCKLVIDSTSTNLYIS